MAGERTQMFKLVKNNVEALYQDILTECLYKTFTDTLEVIRALGISYLWIDSVCIVLEDDEDVYMPRPLLSPTLEMPSKLFLVVLGHLLYWHL
jgi:hypothetical protein